jgi:hypothetical protein
MPDIPTSEPTEIIQGLTCKWTRTDLHTDYPASDWTLTYYFVGPTAWNKAATADGDDYDVTLSAAETTALLPGRYKLYGRVSYSGELYEIYRADCIVIEDPAAVEMGEDQRSWARRCLEKVETALEGSTDSLILNYSIGGAGRTIGKMSVGERIKWRDYFAAKVQQEEQQALADAGKATGRKILIRFNGV